MKKSHTIALTVTALCLTSCFSPYVGRDHNTGSPCASAGFFIPVASSPESYPCDRLSTYERDQHIKKKGLREKLPESSKHVIYSENERLRLAELAARKFFPAENNIDVLAGDVASLIKYYGKIGSGDMMIMCRYSETQKRLADYIKPKLPMDLFYKNLAADWSSRYSDDQITIISSAANEGKSPETIEDALEAQGIIDSVMAENYPVYLTKLNFVKSHKQEFVYDAVSIRSKVVALFPAEQKCGI